MSIKSTGPQALVLLGMLTMAAPVSLSAQQQTEQNGDLVTTVTGAPMTEGPDVEGIISARSPDSVQVTAPNGTVTNIIVDEGTEIRGKGGFLGLGRTKLTTQSLLNGLPVSVKTLQSGEGLLASRISFSSKDLETADMIRNGTAQRFAEQRVDIDGNTAAADALRSRVGDIDKYNIKGTTNVYFDTGKWNLTDQSESELCSVATEAEAMGNALLLVVGYTDSVGSQDYNQVLSERRAGRVVNHLQQQCGWEPWRMLAPTGMAESDPLASNDTAAGKAQNRRVSVNILVSKSVEGL